MSELIERPQFLPADQKGTGFEGSEEYVLPAYFKIVQAQSALTEQFEPGTVITDRIPIILPGEKFHFTPLLWYPEWTIHNPYAAGLDFIRDRTMDPNSELAQKAKSRSFDERQFPCPEKPNLMCTYVEHHNFVVYLHDHNDALAEGIAVMSFFKGEWKTGLRFHALIRARKVTQEQIPSTVFQCSTSRRSGKEGNWFGYDIVNPEERAPWVEDESEFKKLAAIARGLQGKLGEVTYDVE